MRQKGRESGVGRWDEWWLEGLTLRELAHLEGRGEEAEAVVRRSPGLIDRYLTLGGFPEIVLHGDSIDTGLSLRRLREAVVEKAILRDIAREVRNPEPVRALFVYLVQQSGGIWNASKRATDLGSDERSVSQWQTLLGDTLLVTALRRYAAHAAASLRSRPKLYAADHGLVQAFAVAAHSDTERQARVLETAVFRHLREVERGYAHLSGSLSYYRDRRGLEADFVLELPENRVVVEVTASRRVKAEKLERLRAVGDRVDAQSLVLVYGGLVSEEVEGVQVTPATRFLLDPKKAVAA
jgi:predicted AAA+ superfamily ATPase